VLAARSPLHHVGTDVQTNIASMASDELAVGCSDVRACVQCQFGGKKEFKKVFMTLSPAGILTFDESTEAGETQRTDVTILGVGVGCTVGELKSPRPGHSDLQTFRLDVHGTKDSEKNDKYVIDAGSPEHAEGWKQVFRKFWPVKEFLLQMVDIEGVAIMTKKAANKYSKTVQKQKCDFHRFLHYRDSLNSKDIFNFDLGDADAVKAQINMQFKNLPPSSTQLVSHGSAAEEPLQVYLDMIVRDLEILKQGQAAIRHDIQKGVRAIGGKLDLIHKDVVDIKKDVGFIRQEVVELGDTVQELRPLQCEPGFGEVKMKVPIAEQCSLTTKDQTVEVAKNIQELWTRMDDAYSQESSSTGFERDMVVALLLKLGKTDAHIDMGAVLNKIDEELPIKSDKKISRETLTDWVVSSLLKQNSVGVAEVRRSEGEDQMFLRADRLGDRYITDCDFELPSGARVHVDGMGSGEYISFSKKNHTIKFEDDPEPKELSLKGNTICVISDSAPQQSLLKLMPHGSTFEEPVEVSLDINDAKVRASPSQDGAPEGYVLVPLRRQSIQDPWEFILEEGEEVTVDDEGNAKLLVKSFSYYTTEYVKITELPSMIYNVVGQLDAEKAEKTMNKFSKFANCVKTLAKGFKFGAPFCPWLALLDPDVLELGAEIVSGVALGGKCVAKALKFNKERKARGESFSEAAKRTKEELVSALLSFKKTKKDQVSRLRSHSSQRMCIAPAGAIAEGIPPSAAEALEAEPEPEYETASEDVVLLKDDALPTGTLMHVDGYGPGEYLGLEENIFGCNSHWIRFEVGSDKGDPDSEQYQTDRALKLKDPEMFAQDAWCIYGDFDAVASAEAVMRKSLGSVKRFTQLENRAKELGASDDEVRKVKELPDKAERMNAMIELIVPHTQVVLACRTKQAEEEILEKLKLPDLEMKAKDVGVPDDAVDQANNDESPELALIKLIVDRVVYQPRRARAAMQMTGESDEPMVDGTRVWVTGLGHGLYRCDGFERSKLLCNTHVINFDEGGEQKVKLSDHKYTTELKNQCWAGGGWRVVMLKHEYELPACKDWDPTTRTWGDRELTVPILDGMLREYERTPSMRQQVADAKEIQQSKIQEVAAVQSRCTQMESTEVATESDVATWIRKNQFKKAQSELAKAENELQKAEVLLEKVEQQEPLISESYPYSNKYPDAIRQLMDTRDLVLAAVDQELRQGLETLASIRYAAKIELEDELGDMEYQGAGGLQQRALSEGVEQAKIDEISEGAQEGGTQKKEACVQLIVDRLQEKDKQALIKLSMDHEHARGAMPGAFAALSTMVKLLEVNSQAKVIMPDELQGMIDKEEWKYDEQDLVWSAITAVAESLTKVDSILSDSPEFECIAGEYGADLLADLKQQLEVKRSESMCTAKQILQTAASKGGGLQDLQRLTDEFARIKNIDGLGGIYGQLVEQRDEQQKIREEQLAKFHNPAEMPFGKGKLASFPGCTWIKFKKGKGKAEKCKTGCRQNALRCLDLFCFGADEFGAGILSAIGKDKVSVMVGADAQVKESDQVARPRVRSLAEEEQEHFVENTLKECTEFGLNVKAMDAKELESMLKDLSGKKGEELAQIVALANEQLESMATPRPVAAPAPAPGPAPVPIMLQDLDGNQVEHHGQWMSVDLGRGRAAVVRCLVNFFYFVSIIDWLTTCVSALNRSITTHYAPTPPADTVCAIGSCRHWTIVLQVG
jgi:hypothetical protein